MRPGHGNVQILSLHKQVPRTAELGLLWLANPTIRQWRTACQSFETRPGIASLLTDAGNGCDLFGLQINLSQYMVLGIGDVECFAMQCHALRVIKGCFGKITVSTTASARADDSLQLSFEAADDNPIMIAVRNE